MNKIFGFKDTIYWYEINAHKYAQAIADIASLDLIDRFAKALPPQAKVLDAGCAAGRDCKLLADRGLKVTGIDLSKNLLTIARAKYPEIEFVEGNFLNLPFPDQEFNGVWANASLLHLETIEEVTKALIEFNRVLKPNGILHVAVKKQPGAEKTEVVTDKLSGHKRFFRWFEKDELKHLLQQSNFEVKEIADDYADFGGRAKVTWIIALARKK